MLAEQNASVFEAMAGFLRTAAAAAAAVGAIDHGELPTALLCAGINVADHAAAFAGLRAHLRAHLSPHVASLCARDAASGGLRALVRALLVQLTASAAAGSADHPAPPPPTGDLDMLSAWYAACPGASLVVVVLEDLEAFDGRDVAALVELLVRQRHRMPVAVVLGLASAPEVLHSIVARETMARLNTQRFRLRDSASNLPSLYECGPPVPRRLSVFAFAHVGLVFFCRLLFNAPAMPFRLDPQPLNELLDAFLYQHLSVRAFVRGLRLALLSHCMDHPLVAAVALTTPTPPLACVRACVRAWEEEWKPLS